MLTQITRRALALGIALTPAIVVLAETAGYRVP